jgi:hypothetical protein
MASAMEKLREKFPVEKIAQMSVQEIEDEILMTESPQGKKKSPKKRPSSASKK